MLFLKQHFILTNCEIVSCEGQQSFPQQNTIFNNLMNIKIEMKTVKSIFR